MIALRVLRRARGLSQIEVAHVLGVTQSIISRLELAKIRPSKTLQTRIADYFQMPIKQLLGRVVVKNASTRSLPHG